MSFSCLLSYPKATVVRCCICGKPIVDSPCVALLSTECYEAEESHDECEIEKGDLCVDDDYIDDALAHASCINDCITTRKLKQKVTD